MQGRIDFINAQIDGLRSSKVFGEVTDGYVFVTKIAGPDYPWAGTSHYYCRRVKTPDGYVSPLSEDYHGDGSAAHPATGGPAAATQRRRLQTAGGSSTDGSTAGASSGDGSAAHTNDDGSAAVHSGDDSSAGHNDDGSAAMGPTTGGAAGDYCPAEEGCVMYNGRQVWFDPNIDYSEDNHVNCLEQGFCWETPNCPDFDNAKMEDVEFW